MKTKLLLLMAATALAPALLAGEAQDGYLWRSFSYPEKVIWVGGWMQGYFQGKCEGAPDCTRSLAWMIGNKFRPVGPNQFEAINGPYAPQMAEGMDRFYSADFRNMSVSMNDAVAVVLMTLRGFPSEMVTRRIRELREIYCGGK